MYKLQRKSFKSASKVIIGIGELGVGIHVCLVGEDSYYSITRNWINLEYVFIVAFDYKSWQRTWHTFGTDIYTKNGIWFALFTNYEIRDTRYVYLIFNILTFERI